jgi:hypothetical protein
MANIRISQLPANPTAITGTELVPITQNGQTVHTTVSQITNSPSQTQTFLTTTQEASLPNSRYIGGGLGIGTSNGGAQGLYSLFLNGTSASLENASTGLIVKSGVNTVVNRLIAAGTAGLSVSNGDGIAGDPTISLTNLALSIATLSGNGMVSLVNGSYFQNVTLTGAANQISIANPNGGSNPTFSIASNPTIPGTAGMVVPSGTTGERASVPTDGQMRYNTTSGRFEFYEGGSWANIGTGDGTVTEVFNVPNQTSVTNGTTTPTIGIASNPILPGASAVTIPKGLTSDRTGLPALGMMRYNTQSNVFEGYLDTGWQSFAVSGGVTSFSAGSTGFTPSSPTGGAIVLGGTLNVSNGGTGATTLTGYVYGNGTGAMTASTTIPNVGLANSSVTYNGVTVALGASGTITATATNPLTISTGLQLNSGTTYDGSVAKTLSIDSTVVTLTGIQTLTNKSMSGSDNTFTNLPNSSLTNSSITIGSTTVSLGGTITTFAGVSISGSTNTLSNIGNSSLTNSAVTINGTSVSLGGSITVTATASNALTIGTGLSGTSYNGSSPVTIAIDSTVVTLTGVQTLTGKSISGSTNTLTNIPNVALTNSSLTVGSTVISLGATSTTLAGLVSVTLTQDPTLDLQAATKQYVDTKVSTGLTYHEPVQAATTQSLAAQTGGTVTYVAPGPEGVGATITLSIPLLVLDGYTLLNTNRILVKNEVNQAYNGVYTWATGGLVLTRATDADTYGSNVNQLSQNDYFFVQNGTVNKGSSWVITTVGVINFTTTPITFAEFSNSQVYSAGTGLTLTGTTFSITNTGVANGSYGTASSVPTLAINAQGQVTSASNTAIAINANQVTSGILATTVGGTGLSAFTSGGAVYATSTSALATGTLPVTAGGIGVATLSGLAYGNGTSAFTAASAAQVVAVIGSTAVTNATNAANVAVTTGAATTNYIHFGTATTGNLPVLTNTNFTYNSSTSAITGGISGGTF